MLRLILILCAFICIGGSCRAQFSRQDTLRGTITPERSWWNVLHYDITIEPDFDSKTLRGTNVITFLATSAGKVLQLDLQAPMAIDRITYKSKPLPFTRNGNVFYLHFPDKIEKQKTAVIEVQFSGGPQEALNPPWDGGWIWKKDSLGNPWMSAACQILGGSAWYPCKDHQADEPDSARLQIVVPDSLVGVGNGRLTAVDRMGGKRKKYTWEVKNPINNYNIIPYIGKYENWTEKFNGEKGTLDLSYWVLKENVSKARRQFVQVHPMLKCFEHWFGPYPFYEDSYKLVESPHLGMEHQSAVAYGNKFQNGYLGKDLSKTGWGEKWDFIIIHESAHEWFANNITTRDVADMWIHEGFTNYAETIYTGWQFGKKAGEEYCQGLQEEISNDIPIIGIYGVNKEGSGDMYNKGGSIVHMIRQIINDDERFRMILRGLNKDFYHQTVTSAQVESYITEKSGINFSAVFDQYLRTVQVPELQYRVNNKVLQYRWANCIPGFNMPLRIFSGKEIWLTPSQDWKEVVLPSESFQFDRNFYIATKKL